MDKTHHTAVVIIPPESVWPGIQAIRRRYDRQVDRWMPHATLLYPFRPPERFEEVTESLADRAGRVRRFELSLVEFDTFRHGRGSFTLWLRPEPPEPIIALQASLLAAVPDCDEQNRHAHGFRPHLSVGQCRSQRELGTLLEHLRQDFQPVRFVVESVAMIRRSGRPGDPFRVDRTIPLGAEA